jgi:DNA polymerase
LENLEALHEQIRACRACPLGFSRTQAVPGAGNAQAKIMIVGEAPGKNEDLQGVPFVGAAGQLLNKLLISVGLSREDVYITNTIKCRPPENRDPLPNEVEACSGYLDTQVEMIKPAIILLLGRHSLQRFLPGRETISKMHGRLVIEGDRAYVPLYHPAAALYNGGLLETLEEDFRRVKGYIEQMEAKND